MGNTRATRTLSAALAVRILRDLGMPRAEIDQILATSDPRVVRRYLDLHLERLEERLAEARATLVGLEPVHVARHLERRSRVGAEVLPWIQAEATSERSAHRGITRMRGAQMSRRSVFASLVLGAFAIPLGACVIDADGGGHKAPEPTAPDADAIVTIADMSFSPSTVEIEEDETVAWVWDDGAVPHDVVFVEGQASLQQNDGTWKRRFEEPGTYDYACTIHPAMTGKVTVT